MRRLSHTYSPGTPLACAALRDVDLQIAPGERLGILGTTGSGKSTLIQHLAGLLTPTAGQVLLDGCEAHSRSAAARAQRRQVGLAMQYPEDQVFEQTVLREVGFGPRAHGLAAGEVARRVQWALRAVGLDPDAYSARSPFTLSGGELRRVALASILSLRPRVLILDEPTAGLDPLGRRELLTQVEALQQETGLTLIVVSHDVDEIAHTVDRIVLLSDGRLVADGDARSILSDPDRLHATGLRAPVPVALVRALKDAGWPVRTDCILPEEAADEIRRVRHAAGWSR